MIYKQRKLDPVDINCFLVILIKTTKTIRG